MKADLPHLEPTIQARWEEIGIYHEILKARKDAPTFVLHDGPPYTNEPIHIGTAMNKILKDIVVKSRTIMGYRAPYVPGYDNHGLPIEQTVMKQFHAKKEQPDILTIRKACREHARKYVDVQTRQFKRLGVFGLWEKPYTTMNFRYEAEIVRVFKRLVEGGYVYRGLRPTLWSPTLQTSLADTEIVYKDHVSKAIYVRFPLREDPNKLFTAFPNFYTIIWTTTPWTIPANLAVAFHPDFQYAVVKVGDVHYLVLESLVPRIAGDLGWTDYEVKETVQGVNLWKTVFKHPIFDRDSVAVMADYVTTEDGTGVVHTAPGHGREDFMTGVEHNLDILCPVDERGILTEEAGEFAGISYKDCDKAVVDRLQEVGALLRVSDYTHSYPHGERDGQPVIFRATEQWFIDIDHNHLRSRMVSKIKEVEWFPPNSQNRIEAMVGGRPDWCISRQLPWGVGIPVFYGKQSRKPLLDPAAIEAVVELIEREGSDAWFYKDPAEILPAGYKHPETGETEFEKEVDVLDVWFDSGATSLCVLEGNVEPLWKEHWPADLYLEGSDQHRGWFNSSLVVGMAARGDAPYKQVLTHGWVMDEKGMKMSKRLGNVIEPEKASEQYGADVLRYWTAATDYTNDVPCSDGLLKQFGENYRRIRNTLRFLLSNLYDYDPAARRPELLELDHWIVEKTDLLVADCAQAYKAYDFGKVIGSIHNFCVQELSSFYLDAIKDRMYCDGKDWESRRSGQAACHDVLTRLLILVSPILVHTAEEAYARVPMRQKLPSVHMETLRVPTEDEIEAIQGNDLEVRFAALLEVRAGAFAAFEQWKVENGVKDSQDVVAKVTESADTVAILKSFGSDLPNYFKMSGIELEEGPAGVEFRRSEYLKCERCRLRRPDVQAVDGVPLSARDRKVLGL
jgi:isoleucyl-tRNA synthetase